MNKIINIILLTISMALMSCSSSAGNSGNEFLGKWQNINFDNDSLEISKNGDDFIVARTSFSLMTLKMDTEKLPMQMKDRVLRMDAGVRPTSITYVKSTDTLSGVGLQSRVQEYKSTNELSK